MKVITIKQPFATLIAKGYKTYEFRSWKTSYRGKILIHAAKGVDKNNIDRESMSSRTDHFFDTFKIYDRKYKGGNIIDYLK